jgi:DNA-binding transcriptional LysR family regulator
MHIDPVRLYRLRVVIDEKNLSRAARRLGLSQPTLSASIAQFERDLGVKLLERGRHGAYPTAFGSVLYDRSKVIEAELKRASQDLEEVASADAGHLAIGASAGAAAKLICQTVARILKNNPGVTVDLVEDWSDAVLLAKLRRRELDWVISTVSDPVDGLESRPLFKTRRVFAVRSGHSAIRGRRIDIGALLECPLIAPEGSTDLRTYIDSVFVRLGGVIPRIGVTGNSLALAKEILQNTDYFAVLSEVLIAEEIKAGTIRAFDIPVETEYWYRILRDPRRGTSARTQRFLQELGAVCRTLGLAMDVPRNRGRW